jgi:pimeloyl-ACP methyl ester carboxylesterase
MGPVSTTTNAQVAPALAYDRRGSGPPLVLLHPLGADRRVWDPVLDRLAAERDVIAIDLPGFGDSPVLDAEQPTPAALAAAVRAFAEDGLGLRGWHVAGNSLGGWVALVLALDGAVESVTAVAPAGLWSAPLAPRQSVARRAARLAAPIVGPAVRSRALRRAILRGTVGHPERVPPEAAARLVRAYARAPGFPAVNAAMRAGHFTDLGRIEVPVTLVWPELDGLVGRPRRLPPHVRDVRLTDCGHLPMWDDPAAVSRALLDGSAVGARER